jgi:hypothetical protein
LLKDNFFNQSAASTIKKERFLQQQAAPLLFQAETFVKTMVVGQHLFLSVALQRAKGNKACFSHNIKNIYALVKEIRLPPDTGFSLF